MFNKLSKAKIIKGWKVVYLLMGIAFGFMLIVYIFGKIFNIKPVFLAGISLYGMVLSLIGFGFWMFCTGTSVGATHTFTVQDLYEGKYGFRILGAIFMLEGFIFLLNLLGIIK